MTRAFGSVVAISTLVVLGIIAASTSSHSEREPGDKLTIGIYTPTVQFANSAARLAYIQSLAKSVSTNTGMKVEGLSFTNLANLLDAKPDFAVIDAQCLVTAKSWKLLANAQIDGRISRPWALYSSLGNRMTDLSGQKLAFVKTGCNDQAFIENAMLESELPIDYFGERVGKSDLPGAVAEVATYRGAQAVFAPEGSERGLSRVFGVGDVANPAFVLLNPKLSDEIVEKVRSAVVSYGAQDAIEGWAAADDQPLQALQGRMAKRTKMGLFVAPEPVKIDARDVLVEPPSMSETALPDVGQHFEKPPERQE